MPSGIGARPATIGASRAHTGSPVYLWYLTMHASPALLSPQRTCVLAAAAGTASASSCATKVVPPGQSPELMRFVVEISYSGVTVPSAALQPAYGVPASRLTPPDSPASSKAA